MGMRQRGTGGSPYGTSPQQASPQDSRDFAMIESRYRDLCAELDHLISHGHAISRAMSGKLIENQRQEYGDPLYGKLLAHAATVRRLLPSGLKPRTAGAVEVWDISSICTLARALIETYDALAYLAVEPVDTQERQFRVLLWNLHDQERREKMLGLIGSRSPEVSNIRQRVVALRHRVLTDASFQDLDPGTKKQIESKRAPPFHLSQRERNRRNGISHEYYNATEMFLSAYIHSFPFAIHQLMHFRAGDADSLQLLGIPVQYTLGFLSKGIEGMHAAFGNALPDMDENTSDVVDVWVEIVGKGVTGTLAASARPPESGDSEIV